MRRTPKGEPRRLRFELFECQLKVELKGTDDSLMGSPRKLKDAE
jgi:hypothetical protein